MTHTSTEQPELLPCPFCGSHLVSQSTGWTGEGNPFPYIECEECAATADPAFWNRRTTASQARVPLSEEEIFNIYCQSDSELSTTAKNLTLFVRDIEVAHGITQEKQG